MSLWTTNYLDKSKEELDIKSIKMHTDYVEVVYIVDDEEYKIIEGTFEEDPQSVVINILLSFHIDEIKREMGEEWYYNQKKIHSDNITFISEMLFNDHYHKNSQKIMDRISYLFYDKYSISLIFDIISKKILTKINKEEAESIVSEIYRIANLNDSEWENYKSIN